jgi:KipI family sensor histidine kinase inhibitor
VLAEFDSLDEVLGAAEQLRRDVPACVVEVVPAARTVLVVHDGSADLAELERRLVSARAVTADDGASVEIPVHYDGVDLAEVASFAGCSVDEVVELHGSVTYRVAFCGFVPGFAYLTGLPEVLRMPRLSSPRPRVDPGSVAIAGEWAGVYPTASPGGWRLLGHTDVVLWDEMRARPSLLEPGMRVRFVPR